MLAEVDGSYSSTTGTTLVTPALDCDRVSVRPRFYHFSLLTIVVKFA